MTSPYAGDAANSLKGTISEIVEENVDVFDKLLHLRATKVDAFNALGSSLAAANVSSPDYWRFLSLHYLRQGNFKIASDCNSRHRSAAPFSEDAQARAIRLALLQGRVADAMDLTASPLLSNSLAFKKMQFALRIAADSETSRIDLGRDLQTAARAAFSDASEYVEPAGGYDDSYQLRREQNRTTFRQTLKIFDEANSVALVGNGSVLKGSGLGKAIDSHDVVVRINWPAIKGYSDDVGSNTSLVLFVEQYMHGAINQDSLLKKMSQYNSSVPGLALDAGRTVSTVFPEFCGEPPSNICLMPAAARKCLKYLGYQYATTGLLSMLLISLILNKTVTIFGFDFYRDLNRQYYFGTTPPDPHLTHELQYEVWMVRQFFARILPDKLLMPGSV